MALVAKRRPPRKNAAAQKPKSHPIDWRRYLSPVSLDDLAAVFATDVDEVREKIDGLEQTPDGMVDFVSAAERLVDPVADVHEYLRGMRVQDMPREFKPTFWTGMMKRLEARHEMGELWHAEVITYIVSQSLGVVKSKLSLYPDRTADELRMTEDEREQLIRETHFILNRMHDRITGLPEKSTTFAMHSEVYDLSSRDTDNNTSQEERGTTASDDKQAPETGMSFGVSLEALQRIFGRDRRSVKSAIATLEPVGDDRGNPTYDLGEASAYLVAPSIDLGNVIEEMRLDEVPVAINSAYWEAKSLRLKYIKEAAEYWTTPDVVKVTDTMREIVVSELERAPCRLIEVFDHIDGFAHDVTTVFAAVSEQFTTKLQQLIDAGNAPDDLFKDPE